MDEAAQLLREKVKLPAGYAVAWSGQYEAMAARARAARRCIVPLTLFLIFLLLYLNTRSAVKTAIVLLAVPFSAIGAVWFLYLLGYNMSVGVWVGLIALLGVDAETGVFMLLYLDLAYEQARKEGRLRTLADLQEAIVQGAAKRLRPKFMTVATTFLGLVPIMWATGTGSDVMKRIAAPDDRRHLHVVPARARRLPGDLRDLEVELRAEAEAGARRGRPLDSARLKLRERWADAPEGAPARNHGAGAVGADRQDAHRSLRRERASVLRFTGLSAERQVGEEVHGTRRNLSISV